MAPGKDRSRYKPMEPDWLGAGPAAPSAAVVPETAATKDVPRVVPPAAKLEVRGKVVFGYWHSPARPMSLKPMARLRVAEIGRLIQHRHGPRCDTDDRELYADALLQVAPLNLCKGLLELALGMRDIEIAAAVASVGSQASKGLSAGELGNLLCLRYTERLALRIRTIRAFDVEPVSLEQRREADRRRKMEKARAAGVRPRTLYEAGSVSAQARKEGVSRSTIYRRRIARSRETGGNGP